MNQQMFNARNIYEYRSDSVQGNIDLFVTSKNMIANTLLYHILMDNLAADDKLVAYITIDDYDAWVNVMPDLENHERVRLLIYGTNEFQKIISSGHRIYTASFLPEYFVKKAGQIIYGIFLPDTFLFFAKTKNRITRGLSTEHKLDYLLDWQGTFLQSAYTREKDRIVCYFSRQSSMFRSASKFKAFHENIDMLANNCEAVVEYISTVGFWKQYLDNLSDYPQGISVVPRLADFCDIMTNTRLVLTDIYDIALFADRDNIPVVFYENPAKEREMNELSERVAVGFTDQDMWEVAGQLFNGLQHHRIEEKEKNIQYKWIKQVNETENKTLLITDWKTISLWLKLAKERNQTDVDVEFPLDILLMNSSKGEVYRHLSDIPKNIHISIRTGYFQCHDDTRQFIYDNGDRFVRDDPVSDPVKEMAVSEWKRILGDVWYKQVLALDTKDPFWKVMYQFAPGNDKKILKKKEICAEVAPLFYEMCFHAAEDMNPDNHLVTIMGREYYSLSNCCNQEDSIAYYGNKEYYLEKEVLPEKYVVCLYHGNNRLFCADTWEIIKENGWKLVFPGVKEDAFSDVFEDDEVVYIKIRSFPWYLLFGAEGVISDAACLETDLAKCAHVKTYIADQGES